MLVKRNKVAGGYSIAIATMGRGTFIMSSTGSEGALFVPFAVFFVRIAQVRYRHFRVRSIQMPEER